MYRRKINFNLRVLRINKDFLIENKGFLIQNMFCVNIFIVDNEKINEVICFENKLR